MWFIFPQWKGLGESPTANFYAIASRREAGTYLAHAILGSRMMECTRLVNLVEGRTVQQIFGYPDDLKFRSSMTLFANVAGDSTIFVSVRFPPCVPRLFELESVGEVFWRQTGSADPRPYEA